MNIIPGFQYSARCSICVDRPGRAARLSLPTGPRYGLIAVSVDGSTPQNISLYAPSPRDSSVVWRWREPEGEGNLKDAGADPQQLRHAHAVALYVCPRNHTVTTTLLFDFQSDTLTNKVLFALYTNRV